MSARWWAFGLWGAVAAVTVFWALKLFVPGRPAPVHTTVAAAAAAPRGDLSRLLGADAPEQVDEEPQAAPASARFQLVGVVAPKGERSGGQGVALIAVDGKPAKAFRVGTAVDGDLVLRAVRQRGADLGPRSGQPNLALEIPPPAPAATATLPPPGGAVVAPPRPVMPAPQQQFAPAPPLPPGMAAPQRPAMRVNPAAAAEAPRTDNADTE